MKIWSTVAVMALAVSGASNASALSLTLVNNSKYEIHELYFSPASQKSWGEDQLEDEVIEKGAEFTLKKISAGKYDVKIVDEDSDACVIPDVDFNASERFVLTNKILTGCQAGSQQDESEDDEE